MPSAQNSAGAGKAAKFINANPLGPMANPFEGMDDDEKEYQKVVGENVNKRMEKAMGEIKARHANGTAQADDPDHAPTGDAYKKHQMGMAKKTRDAKQKATQQRQMEVQHIQAERENMKHQQNQNDDDYNSDSGDESDEYDELLEGLDHDPEISAIRNSRMQMMKAKQMEAAENKAKGHGSLRLITQDEFLTEVTTSTWVAVHFYHKDFERCKIMDHHLEMIAPMHIECKFVKIDAEKCPFFIQKLQVQTLPTLMVFKDGVTEDKLTGFQGLSNDPSDPDVWHTGKLQQWLAMAGCIKYAMPTDEMKDEMKRLGIVERGAIWSENRATCDSDDDDYD
ncbi:hypothetical protein ScalyP_jg1155 [Parmales sp. scaly parma]|nr:hypothetical protein ScalyP_jg1155 [Parmales sp. scaly parma]